MTESFSLCAMVIVETTELKKHSFYKKQLYFFLRKSDTKTISPIQIVLQK